MANFMMFVGEHGYEQINVDLIHQNALRIVQEATESK